MSLKLIYFNPFFWLIFSIFIFLLMPNYRLFTNFVFCRFLFKNEKISARKKRKIAITAVYVTTEFCVSRQTSKQMAKEICHDNISSIATQRAEYRRSVMS